MTRLRKIKVWIKLVITSEFIEKKEAMNLKEIREGYMLGFGGRKREGRNVVINL